MLLLRSAVSSMAANAKKPRQSDPAGLQFQCKPIKTSLSNMARPLTDSVSRPEAEARASPSLLVYEFTHGPAGASVGARMLQTSV